MMWHEWTLYSFYMATVVGIVSRHGLSIDAYHRNQYDSPLVQYKKLISLQQLFETLVYKLQRQSALVIKVGVARLDVHILRRLQAKLAWAIDNRLLVFKTFTLLRN